MSWDGPTKSALTARLSPEDLQLLFDVAVKAELVRVPACPRLLELIEELRAELQK